MVQKIQQDDSGVRVGRVEVSIDIAHKNRMGRGHSDATKGRLRQ